MNMNSAMQDGPPGLNTAMPIPHPPPPPAPAQSSSQNIEAMLQMILSNTEKHDKQLTKVCREQGELKEIASKALTTATQVKDDMESLTARVVALEQQKSSPPSSSVSSRSDGPYSPKSIMTGVPYATTSRWNTLGGAEGNLMVIGGFPQWSRTETLRAFMIEQIFPKISPEHRNMIDEKTLRIPAPRGQTIQLEIVKSADPTETRRILMKLIKDLKALNLQVTTANGDNLPLWISASKPPEVRKLDNNLTENLVIVKRLFAVTEEKDSRLDFDYARGRIFWNDRLVAHRRANETEMSFRLEALKQSDATITLQRLEDLRATIRKERETKQAST